MLVLTRKVGQRVRVGENISIMVVRVKGKAVRLGIEAPSELLVLRAKASKRRAPAKKLNGAS